jgi:uncharacterized protein (TIGR02246 family)
MFSTRYVAVAFVALGLGLVLLPGDREPTARAQAGQSGKKGAGRDADREAIRKSTQSFIKAFENGDAKAVAAHWTAEGEFIEENGTVTRGREAIARSYGELFKKKRAKAKLDVQVESLRFTSRDTAIEEGTVALVREKGENTTSRYSLLHVREDGKWLIAVAREWPAEAASLRDLGWLIGAWVAKRDGVEVRTTYQWTLDKAFIQANFTIEQDGRTVTGMQIIGKDAAMDAIRTWTFESEGGIGDAIWSQNGKKWQQDAKAVLSNGGILSATNIMTQLDSDSFTWQSINRSINDEELPDIAPIKVTRVKGKN